MDTITISSILSLGVIQLLAVMSPGPDFALVVLNSIRYHRAKALATVAGIMAGNAVHLTYCVLGLVLIIVNIPILFNGIKIAGAVYLVYIGINAGLSFVKSGKNAVKDAAVQAKQISARAAFVNGFTTNVLNIKCALYYAALFSQYLSQTLPPAAQVVYVAELLIVGALWFSFVAIVMTKASIKRRFLAYRRWIDLTLGIIISAFGLFVLYETIGEMLAK